MYCRFIGMFTPSIDVHCIDSERELCVHLGNSYASVYTTDNASNMPPTPTHHE